MAARTAPEERAIPAIPPFNGDLFNRRCELYGATTEAQRAELVDVDVSTLSRFRRRLMGPRLELARRIAERLGVTVDDLWPKTHPLSGPSTPPPPPGPKQEAAA